MKKFGKSSALVYRPNFIKYKFKNMQISCKHITKLYCYCRKKRFISKISFIFQDGDQPKCARGKCEYLSFVDYFATKALFMTPFLSLDQSKIHRTVLFFYLLNFYSNEQVYNLNYYLFLFRIMVLMVYTKKMKSLRIIPTTLRALHLLISYVKRSRNKEERDSGTMTW